MGTADWRTGEPLNARLVRRPAGFDFFQWVRLSSWPRRADADATVDRAVSARAGAGRVDARLRFRGELSAAFPGSEISAGRTRQPHRRGAVDGRTELYVSDFSVLGVLGPMPDSFADWVRERLAERDPGMAEFLDIFNHRISTLRYELKAASVPAFDGLHPEHTRYAGAVGAIMGLHAFDGEAAPILARHVPIPRRALLALSGLLCSGRRSAATAELVLGLYLHAPVRVEALRGAWRRIEDADRTRLGRRRMADVAPLGRRVWVNHAAVGIRVGPVAYARLCAWLPDRAPGEESRFGRAHDALAAMLRYLFDRRVDAVVEVEVDEDGLPMPVLWRPRYVAGFGNHGMRLGQTAWLRGRPPQPRCVRFVVRADATPEAA